MVKQTPEYRAFKYLQHWLKEDDIQKLKAALSDGSSLFSYLLSKTEELYAQLPKRKDGQEALLHPLNVVLALRDAKINDQLLFL